MVIGCNDSILGKTVLIQREKKLCTHNAECKVATTILIESASVGFCCYFAAVMPPLSADDVSGGDD